MDTFGSDLTGDRHVINRDKLVTFGGDALYNTKNEIVINIGIYRRWFLPYMVPVIVVFSCVYFVWFFGGNHGFGRAIGAPFGIGVLGYAVQKALRERPWLPFITATQDGILYSQFSAVRIPWSAVESMRILQRHDGVDRARLDVRIRTNAERTLVKKCTIKSALLTPAPGKPNISIELSHLRHMSIREAYSALTTCQRHSCRSDLHELR